LVDIDKLYEYADLHGNLAAKRAAMQFQAKFLTMLKSEHPFVQTALTAIEQPWTQI
jgi:hypothetical protein